MEPKDPKLENLAALHSLDCAAARILDSLDAKLEVATDETVPVNVEGLKTTRMVIYAQRVALKSIVEAVLKHDDLLEDLVAKLEKK